jgi:LPXTG-motif cell wall-anchored protein
VYVKAPRTPESAGADHPLCTSTHPFGCPCSATGADMVTRLYVDLRDIHVKKCLLFGAALAVATMTFPVAAQAVPGGVDNGFVALSTRDAGGQVVPSSVYAGDTTTVTAGVGYNNNVSPQGAVLRIRTLNDVTLPKTFTNCWYVTDANARIAWCKFEETIQMATAYELNDFRVTVDEKATGKLDGIAFAWFGGAYDTDKGGLEELAKADAGDGATPAKGTQKPLTLVKSNRLKFVAGPPAGFAYLDLLEGGRPQKPIPTGTATTPATTAPTTAPATVPTSSAPAPGVAEKPPAAAGSGGGLPITGTNTAVFAGVGAVLVAAGVTGFVLTRRRRNNFVA